MINKEKLNCINGWKIFIFFLAHSAKLENLSETWSCLNRVNGCKFDCHWNWVEVVSL